MNHWIAFASGLLAGGLRIDGNMFAPRTTHLMQRARGA